jgi:co-chaperonin GroES (HSP10)
MKALFEQILIKQHKPTRRETIGGLYVPLKEKNYFEGEVIDIGPEVNESFKEKVKVGDIVIYKQPSPVIINIDGETYNLIYQKNILSKMEKKDNIEI